MGIGADYKTQHKSINSTHNDIIRQNYLILHLCTHIQYVCVYDINMCKSLSPFAVLKHGLQQSCTNKQNEQHEEEDCLNTNCH